MRLVPRPLVIGPRDGFTGTDIFGYESFGTDLAKLVESLEGPSVIALDGGWGAGKTVFARQWAGLLRNRGSAVIYFDAFAADTGDDPLFDIASQLFAAAPDGDKRQEFAKVAIALAKELMPLVAGIGLRAATGGALGEGELRAAVSAPADAKKAARDSGGKDSETFRRRLEGAKDRAKALECFRRGLTSLAGAMRAEALEETGDAVESGRARPIVMIIDELDRCRPTYALTLLENIKHVFNTENMCFVLVTNQEQLANVVAMEYGLTRGGEYLDKFIQATFRLPTDVSLPVHSVRKKYVEHMCKNMLSSASTPIVTESLVDVAHAVGLSLRAIEKVTLNVSMCLEGGVMWHFGLMGAQSPIIPVSICAVRVLSPERYARLKSFELSVETLVDYLRVEAWPIPQQRKVAILEMFRRHFPPQSLIDGDFEARGQWEGTGGYYEVREVCSCLDRFGQQ